MICSNCNGENPPGQTVCVHCGRELVSATSPPPASTSAAPDAAAGPAPASPPLPGPSVPPPAPPGNLVATVIPYKNVPALVAYYLGVFSIIPCVGLPLGIAAVVLGILGLRRAKKNPESKGKVHAWVGIIVGGVFGLLYLLLTILMVVGLIMMHADRM